MNEYADQITESIKKQIILLTSQKRTGKIAITVEINLTQGSINAASMSVKENIKIGVIMK
jgi:hypothetical protein